MFVSMRKSEVVYLIQKNEAPTENMFRGSHTITEVTGVTEEVDHMAWSFSKPNPWRFRMHSTCFNLFFKISYLREYKRLWGYLHTPMCLDNWRHLWQKWFPCWWDIPLNYRCSALFHQSFAVSKCREQSASPRFADRIERAHRHLWKANVLDTTESVFLRGNAHSSVLGNVNILMGLVGSNLRNPFMTSLLF